MTLFGQDVLVGVGRKNKPLRMWLEAWVIRVAGADWTSIKDVRRDYPSADGVPLASGLVVTVFNVKGNEFRLLTWIDYPARIVEVLEVCTHAEYSKNLWKARY
jgi:mRNA interferase HigB